MPNLILMREDGLRESFYFKPDVNKLQIYIFIFRNFINDISRCFPSWI